MVALLVHLGADQYAIDVRHVVEVLPYVDVKAVPQCPAAVLGMLNFHGVPVKVVDLCMQAVGVATRRQFDSRIVLVHAGTSESGTARLLGLAVEQATSTIKCLESDFHDPGVRGATYLGRVMQRDGKIIQLIDPAQVLAMSEDAQAALERAS